MSREKKDRNIGLTLDYLEGMNLKNLSSKYKIVSQNQIKYIIYRTCKKYLLPKDGVWRNNTIDSIDYRYNQSLIKLRDYYNYGIIKHRRDI